MKIAIITPVRNEEKYIRFAIESVLSQSMLPAKWIIVDDGSSDDTGRIIRNALRDARFIEYLCVEDRGYRKPAQGVIESFYAGYRRIERENYDILAKMDGDLKFREDTLERIHNAFRSDPRLGIAGGPRYEMIGGQGLPRKVLLARGYVGGPFKFYRRECFNEIGGLIPRAGWDGVDIVKARMKGWNTGEVESLRIFHLKPTGTAEGEGLARACEKYGDVSYYMGGYLWYFILRAIGRSIINRSPKAGIHMLKGYLRSRKDRVPREPKEFRLYLRKMQQENTVFWLRRLMGVTQ